MELSGGGGDMKSGGGLILNQGPIIGGVNRKSGRVWVPMKERWERDDTIRKEINRLFREQGKKRRCRG